MAQHETPRVETPHHRSSRAHRVQPRTRFDGVPLRLHQELHVAHPLQSYDSVVGGLPVRQEEDSMATIQGATTATKTNQKNKNGYRGGGGLGRSTRWGLWRRFLCGGWWWGGVQPSSRGRWGDLGAISIEVRSGPGSEVVSWLEPSWGRRYDPTYVRGELGDSITIGVQIKAVE